MRSSIVRWIGGWETNATAMVSHPPGPPSSFGFWVSAFQFGFYRRFYWPTNMPTEASFAERRAIRVRIPRASQARAYSDGSGCAKVRCVASLAMLLRRWLFGLFILVFDIFLHGILGTGRIYINKFYFWRLIMAITSFIPTVWSETLQTQLDRE